MHSFSGNSSNILYDYTIYWYDSAFFHWQFEYFTYELLDCIITQMYIYFNLL